MRTKPLESLKYQEPESPDSLFFPAKPKYANAFIKILEAFEDQYQGKLDSDGYPITQAARDIESNCMSFFIGKYKILDELYHQLEMYGPQNAVDIIGFSLKATVYGYYLDEVEAPDLIKEAIRALKSGSLKEIKGNPVARVVALSKLLSEGDIQRRIVMGIKDYHCHQSIKCTQDIMFLLGEFDEI